jgi:hypothetical protein
MVMTRDEAVMIMADFESAILFRSICFDRLALRALEAIRRGISGSSVCKWSDICSSGKIKEKS